MRLDDPARPLCNDLPMLLTGHGIIPPIGQGKVRIFLAIAPATARAFTAYIDDPREFYYELRQDPEATLRARFGWDTAENLPY